MASLNKVMLIGNVTRDPEVRHTPKGTAVAEVGLAVNRRYRVEDETREETTFVDITFWGRQAETIGQYLRKGNPFFCEGRLQLDSWEDKNSGQKRNKLRVIGENFQFLGGGRSDGEGGGYSSGPPQSSSSSSARNSDPEDDSSSRSSSRSLPEGGDEDDIPF